MEIVVAVSQIPHNGLPGCTSSGKGAQERAEVFDMIEWLQYDAG
jgi:hypothetical protein